MSWAQVANLRGPQGADGAQGPQGEPGPQGPGADPDELSALAARVTALESLVAFLFDHAGRERYKLDYPS